MVVVDDYSQDLLGVMSLREKSKAFDQAKLLFKKLQNEKGYFTRGFAVIMAKEFENASFEDFSEECGIMQELSAPITPQIKKNGVIERKNIVIQEKACAMIHIKNLATSATESTLICVQVLGLFLYFSFSFSPSILLREPQNLAYIKVYGLYHFSTQF